MLGGKKDEIIPFGGKNKLLLNSLVPSHLREDVGCPPLLLASAGPGSTKSMRLLAAKRLLFHGVVQGLVPGSNSSSFHCLTHRFNHGSPPQFIHL